jgi:uncharacterized membrane protein
LFLTFGPVHKTAGLWTAILPRCPLVKTIHNTFKKIDICVLAKHKMQNGWPVNFLR